MNKERKCLTFKTNEKSVCASPASFFLSSPSSFQQEIRQASAHARSPRDIELTKVYRWINDDRGKTNQKNSNALQAPSLSFDVFLTSFFER